MNTVKAGNHLRYKSSSVSRYANIPTENIKFHKFIDILFASTKMTMDDKKDQIKLYVTALETRYNELIQEAKSKNPFRNHYPSINK